MRTSKHRDCTSKLVFFLLITLSLTGCKPNLIVDLASQQERLPSPRFNITDPRQPGQRPLYDTIKLVDASGQLYWHLRAEPFGTANSVSSFAYGETLRGFTAVVSAKPLEANHEYSLGVLGEGVGTIRFRVDAAGQIRPVTD